MITAVTALPWLSPTLAGQTLGGMCPELRNYVVQHDGRDGAPVAQTWNRAREYVIDGVAPWLVICSTAVKFGQQRGLDLIDALHCAPHGMVSVIDASWHLHAIHRDVLEWVGRFDYFERAYCEDSDYIYRHKLAGCGDLARGEGQVHVSIDATMRENAHSIKLGLADPDMPHRAANVYARKWGGWPGHETFIHPYNDETRDWRWLRDDQDASDSWRAQTQVASATSPQSSLDT